MSGRKRPLSSAAATPTSKKAAAADAKKVAPGSVSVADAIAATAPARVDQRRAAVSAVAAFLGEPVSSVGASVDALPASDGAKTFPSQFHTRHAQNVLSAASSASLCKETAPLSAPASSSRAASMVTAALEAHSSSSVALPAAPNSGASLSTTADSLRAPQSAAASSSSSSLSIAPIVVNPHESNVLSVPSCASSDTPKKTDASASASSSSSASALSSSSSSSLSAPRETYYYWIEERASYTEAQIKAHIDTKPFTVVNFMNTTPMVYLDGFRKKKAMLIVSHSSTDRIFEELKRDGSLVVDVSRTAQDTICPLTTEEYERPHILNLNWRSYSGDALRNAIDKTLKLGNQLRLDDGRVVEPEELPHIKLYPNFGLPGWIPYTYTEADVPLRPPFDPAAAERQNIPEFSVWLDGIRKAQDGNGVWDSAIRQIYTERYRPRRADAKPECDYSSPPMFKNLVVQGIVFPRVHPKHPVEFVNVKFSHCVILAGCFCGPKFFSCLFENCTFAITLDSCHEGGWKRCEFSHCSFYTCYGRPFTGVPSAFLKCGGTARSAINQCFGVAKDTVKWYEKEENETVASLIARLKAAPVLV